MPSIFEKLNLKDQKQIVVLGASESFEHELSALRSIIVLRDVHNLNEIEFSLAFVTKQTEVDIFAKAIAKKAKGDAVVWFAYPKGTSKKYKSEINRDHGWKILGDLGFEGVRGVAIDGDWSVIRFRRVEFIKNMKRDMKGAMTKQGGRACGRAKQTEHALLVTAMTEEERKKRGAKSAVIVERLVRVQLRAMGCERFELGIRRDADEMILREGQGVIDIEEAIKWLRHENAKGAHIYVRPAGLHALSLIDDLSAEAIERMKAEGFEPAVVVETSPNNFQAWLNHGQVLEAATSTRAAKALVERFGGDPSSADWRHFGRLAGFTNPKRERQLPSGLRPFARLRSATGRVYSRAAEFLAGIKTSSDGQTGQSEQPHKRPRRSKDRVGVKPLREFYNDPIYAADLHRADMAWAKHAAGCGLTLEQIKTELLDGRDLGKKGSRKRQIEYAERTARKAIEQFDA